MHKAYATHAGTSTELCVKLGKSACIGLVRTENFILYSYYFISVIELGMGKGSKKKPKTKKERAEKRKKHKEKRSKS